MRSFRVGFILVGAATLFGASCSLINSFDPVKQGGGGAGGQPSTTGSTGGGGSGSTTASTGTGGTTSEGGGGTAGSGGSGGAVAKGLIVATGNIGADRVFATLDPSDGHQWKSYAMEAAVVVYDEDTDLWYVFVGEATPPVPGSKVTLHAGRIDPSTGVWTDLHQLGGVPVMRDFSSFAVLNHRIVYKAYDPDSDAGFGSQIGLAIIDTTNPAPKLGGSRGFVAVTVPNFFGLIGTRANVVDGGTVNLVSIADPFNPCTGGVCQVQRTNVSFPMDPSSDPGIASPSNAAMVPEAPNRSSISATWTSRVKGGAQDILVYPPITGTEATIQPFNPSSSQALTPVTFSAATSTQFFGVAIAECEDVLLTTEFSTNALYAVSLLGNGTTSAGTGTSAHVVAYEPITKTVVVPPHIANVPIAGYTLSMTGNPAAPQLAQRNWSAPTNLNADNVTTRRLKQPSAASCGQ